MTDHELLLRPPDDDDTLNLRSSSRSLGVGIAGGDTKNQNTSIDAALNFAKCCLS